MEFLRGVVSQIARSAHVAGDQYGVSTSQIVTCQIQNRAVEISMSSPPNINNGDQLVVAGRSRFGTLQTCAFRNVTNGTSGHWDYQIRNGCGVWGFIAFALFIPPLALIPVIAFPFFVWWVLQKCRIYKAYRAVMSESPMPIQ